MKKYFFVFILFSFNFFFNTEAFSKIEFNNCDFTPNYGRVNLQIDFDNNQILFEEINGISKFLKINDKDETNISAIDNSLPGVNEVFLIDIKYGVIRIELKLNKDLNNSTTDVLKKKKLIINSICEPNNLYSKKDQQNQGVILNAEFEKKIIVATKQCEMVGHRFETEEEKDSMMGCIAYVFAKIEERNLVQKLKDKENIKIDNEYKSKTGEKINKDSKWTKFWQGVGWILHEHGEDIFNVILDVKYGTNYSGYNSKTVSNSERLSCTSHRVGTVVHQNCKGDGIHIYCRYQQVSKSQWKRTCRQK